MLCKVDYSRSQVRDFTSNATQTSHKFLDLFFIPVSQVDAIDEAFDQGQTFFRVTLFPKRNTDGTISTEHENKLVELFTKKQIPPKYVGRVEVNVTPHRRSYGAGITGYNPGDIILDETGNQRIFNTVSITSLMALVEGKEVPVRPMSYYESQARRLLQQRLDQADPVGKWYPVAAQPAATTPAVTDDISSILDASDAPIVMPQ